jgi:hypothetical protein
MEQSFSKNAEILAEIFILQRYVASYINLDRRLKSRKSQSAAIYSQNHSLSTDIGNFKIRNFHRRIQIRAAQPWQGPV